MYFEMTRRHFYCGARTACMHKSGGAQARLVHTEARQLCLLERVARHVRTATERLEV